MADTVTFFNLKGGQGKTTLAAHYALHSGSHFYTNDHKSGTEDLYRNLFPSGRFHLIRERDKAIDTEDKMVFDCGGFIDRKVPALINASDLCVVPVACQSRADLRAFFITVEAVTAMNDRLLIVINNTQTKDVPEIRDGIRNVFRDKYPIKVVKRSSYMVYLANEGKTPFDLARTGETGVARQALSVIREQLMDLYEYIGRY